VDLMRKLITIEIALLLALIIPFIPRSGEDFRTFYQPLARGCLECGYNPPHASLILKPLAFIPWSLWPALTLLLLLWSTRRLSGDPLKLLLAFPTVGLLGLGQVEGVLAAGLALALTTPLQGVGLVLLTVKPQVTGPLMLWVIWRNPRAAVLPGLFLLITLLVFGPAWPLDWLFHGQRPGGHWWMLASWYPYGLALFLVPAVWKRGPLSVLAASALAMPHFSVYSYSLLFLFPVPWWLVLLSWAWLPFIPFLGSYVLVTAWVVPLALLCYPVIRNTYDRIHAFLIRDRLNSVSPRPDTNR
jgi:hypothetical protein